MLSGVRHGCVCSCCLFNLYINNLVRLLKKIGFGCILFNGINTGCALYTDVLLMSGSVMKL